MRPVSAPPRPIRDAAATLLRPHFPALDGDTLLSALRKYGELPPPVAPATPVMPRGMTMKETARALAVSVRTVKNWLRAGKLRAVHLSARAVRIPESEVVRVLALLPEPARCRSTRPRPSACPAARSPWPSWRATWNPLASVPA